MLKEHGGRLILAFIAVYGSISFGYFGIDNQEKFVPQRENNMERILNAMRRCGFLIAVAGITVSLLGATLPAQAQQMLDVKLVPGSEGLSALPVLYAKAAGLFEKAGLKVDWLPITSNVAQLAAMVDSGAADFAQASTSAPFVAQAAGKDIVGFAVFSKGGVIQLVLTNDGIKKIKSGATAKSPLKEKAQGLKGLTIGTPVAGTTVDLQFRDMLEANGVNPDKDLSIAPVTDLTSFLVAAKNGQIDGYVFGPPLASMPVAQGWGQVWIDFTSGEVSGISEAPFGVMIAKREDLTKKAEQAKRMISALRAAVKDINENPELVKKVVKPVFFEKVDDAVFNLAFETIRNSFRVDLTASQEGYQQSLKTMKMIDKAGKPVVIAYDKAFDFSLVKQAK